MSSALITACNNALAQIAAGQIAALTENSIEARECNRFGPQLLEEMADWTPWRALRKRVTLAGTTNDRPAEWLYAYQAPSDLGDPISIRAVEEDAVDLPTFGPYPFPVQNAVPLAFLYEGALIYSNVPDAVLVYSSSTLEASQLSPLMRRAFELELAARIALPIKKDVKLASALQQQAEVARQRAIADEENKVQSHPPRYVSEVEYARAGVGV